jgi:PAS domain S-box-containing protein
MISRILIIDDKTTRRDQLSRYLRDQGYQVDVVDRNHATLERVEGRAYDLLLVGLRTPGRESLELVERVHRSCPDLPQIVLADVEDRHAAVEARRVGAYDVVWEPIEDLSELGFAVVRGLEWRRLIRERALYRSLTDHFPGIIFWSTPQLVVQRIHGRVEEITGYHPEAFTEGGLKWNDIVHSEDLAKVLPQVQQYLIRGEPAEMEYRLERPDGTLRWVECTLMPTRDEGGVTQDILGVVLDLDITGRKQIEMELNQRLQEQESLFAIGQLVSSNLQIDEVMQLVVEYIAHLMDAASCVISDWDPETDMLTVRAEYIRPDQIDPDDPIHDMRQAYPASKYPATARALRDHRPFVVYTDDPQAGHQERHLLQLYRWYGVAGIPLVVQDRVIGLVKVYLAEGDQPFNLHDLHLLQVLANQVAIAIDNARLFIALRTSEATMRDLSLRLINVQEQERRRIAQELHDELGQILTATKINIDLARRKLSQQVGYKQSQQVERQQHDEMALLRRRLDEASALTDEVLTNVRAMTVELRPTLLDDMGIAPTLRWYLTRFAERTGIRVQLETCELPARLRPEIETTIYRVVQEALTNVARHAQADQVQVHLTCSGATVTASVEDDGQGFDVRAWSERPRERQTLGLTGIQERVMLLGGHARITSQPGRGTRVEIELPAHFRAENSR